MSDLLDLPGGFTEWENAGLPITREDGALADHHEQRQHEHDDGHHGHRPAELGPREKHEHEERDERAVPICHP